MTAMVIIGFVVVVLALTVLTIGLCSEANQHAEEHKRIRKLLSMDEEV